MTLTKHYGTMALNEKAQTYWERKNVQFKPILEHHPLTKEEEKTESELPKEEQTEEEIVEQVD